MDSTLFGPGGTARIPAVAAERIFYIIDAVADFSIGMVLTLDGRLSLSSLDEALAHCFRAYPHLALRFLPEGRGFLTAAKAPGPAAEVAAQSGGEDARAGALAWFCKPADALSGPLVRCLVLRGATDTLCLKVHHMAADAGGVKALARFLAEAYQGLAQGGALPRPPQDASRGLTRVMGRFGLRDRLGMLRRTVLDLAGGLALPRPMTLPGYPAPPERRGFAVQSIGAGLAGRAAGWAAARGATVNDVMTAAFLLALKKRRQGGRRAPRAVLTADLRRYLPEGERGGLVANLSGWVPLDLGRALPDDLGGATGMVSKRMDFLKENHLGLSILLPVLLGSRLLPVGLARKAFDRLAPFACARGLIAPSFTNMGRIDGDALRFGNAACREAFLLPPLVHPPVMGVGLSGFRGALTLSMGFSSPGFCRGVVEGFLRGVEEELARGTT